MNLYYLGRAVTLLVLMTIALSAQVARDRDAIPLKPWPAPLYWQPTQAEKQANGVQSNVASNANSGGSDVLSPKALVFVGITPCRVVDTRASQGFAGAFGPPSLAGAATRTIPIQSSACPIPSIAQAYSLNVTAIPSGPLGFITVYPTGQLPPSATTLNSPLGFVVGSAAITPVGTGGSVDVFASGPADVVIDINGYYVAPSGITLAQGTASAPAPNFSGDAGTGIFSSAPGTLNLAAGGTDAVTLNSHGDMNVVGGIHASGPISSGNSLTLNGSSNSLTADSATPPVGGGKPYEIYLGADNPGGPSVPFETIKVGIGTRTPVTKLSIFDSAGAGLNIFTAPISSSAGLAPANVELAIATFPGSYSNIATTGDVVLRADGGATQDLILTSRNSNGGGIRFAAGTSAVSANMEAERMTILSNGSVGIGTSNPSLTGTVAAPPPAAPLLDVNGKVRVEDLPSANAKLVTADPKGVLGSVAFPGANNVVLRGDGTFGPAVSSSNAWLLGGNPIPVPNIFGTTTPADVQIFTNNTYRGLIDKTNGFLHLGTSFTIPQSRLHLGESCAPGTGTVLPWMKMGTFMCSDSDNMYVGPKDEGSNRKDSVIAWGDDNGTDPAKGPDLLRILFTPAGSGSPNGVEMARFLPRGSVGIGDFTTGAQPANRLDVKGNAVIGTGYAGSTAPVSGLAVQGAVGIGTLTPGAKLDVVGQARVSVIPALNLVAGIRLVAVGNNTTLRSINFPNPLDATKVLLGNGTFGSVPGGGGGNVNGSCAGVNFLTKWVTGGVGCSSITELATGTFNVGIGPGTTNPTRQLEVNGDINIPATGPDHHYQILGKTVLSVDGPANTFTGFGAGSSNTGFSNTFTGSGAGSSVNGASNSFYGSNAGASSIGSNNAFFGISVGMGINGQNNTFLGTAAGFGNTQGDNNIYVGYVAGQGTGSGSNDIYIGNSGCASGFNHQSCSENDTIRIGTQAGTPQILAGVHTPSTATYIAGIFGVTIAGGVTVFIDSSGHLGTVQSSRRFKEDIQDMAQASSGLLRLRPVTYRYKQPYADGSKPIDYGLIAEDVAEVYPDLVVKNAEGQVQTVQYHKLVPMLLNEVQKQAQAIQLQQEQNRKLEARLAALETLLSSKQSVAAQSTGGLQ